MENTTYKHPSPSTFQGLYLESRDERNKPRFWIEHDGVKIFGAHQTEINVSKKMVMTLLSYNKPLARKTKQELHLRGIYGASIVSETKSSRNALKIDHDQIVFKVNTHFLKNPYYFEYIPSTHVKSGIVLFNQWHISRSTITNSFDPGITVVHALNNYGVLIEDETPTSKILRFNSGAKPKDAPITFDDIVVRLEEID